MNMARRGFLYTVMALASVLAVAAVPEMWVKPPADAVAVEIAPPLDKTGNFVVSPRTTWAEVPPYQTREGVPHGRLVRFQVPSTASDMYPGIAGPYTRDVWVYVPAGYVQGTVLPLMVDHDGRADAVIQTTLIAVLDNLIAEKRLPMMAGLFIANGGNERPSERSLEYDTVSGKYGEYIEKVIIPLAEQQANVKFSRDGNARGVIGQSSGSAAALGMAWFHNDLYTRVISYSGTFVNIQNNEQYPHGAWEYHENIIPQSPQKKLRVWMHVSDRDNSFNLPEDSYRNWPLANNRMAAKLAAGGYAYQYLWSTDSGHVERGVERQTLEEAMEWVWKNYTAVPKRVLLYHYNATPVAATTPRQIAFLKNQLTAWGYEVEVSDKPADINAARLATLSAVGFINVCFNPYGPGQTGETQTAALESFVRAGGGMFVTHCSSVAFQNATPPNPYAYLIGGRSGRDNFDGQSSCTRTSEQHVSTAMLPASFEYSGNLDNADYLAPDTRVLVRCKWSGGRKLDTAVSWYRTPGKGRVFYTNFAKVDVDYADLTLGPRHIEPGLAWAVGH